MAPAKPDWDHVAAFVQSMAATGEPAAAFAFEKRIIGMHSHWLSEDEAATQCLSFQTISTAEEYERYLRYEQWLVGFFLQLAASSSLFLIIADAARVAIPLHHSPKLINLVTQGTREIASYTIYAEMLGALFTESFDVMTILYTIGEFTAEAEAVITAAVQANGLHMLA